jgi:hypothetical protein
VKKGVILAVEESDKVDFHKVILYSKYLFTVDKFEDKFYSFGFDFNIQSH